MISNSFIDYFIYRIYYHLFLYSPTLSKRPSRTTTMNPDPQGNHIFMEGDFIVFEKGKYFSQVGIVDKCTKKMLNIAIAPHCSNGMQKVRVPPTSLRHMLPQELVETNNWNWDLLNSIIGLY